jgi:TolB-like protein/Tfp pilus assembly protein PilF
MEVPKKSQKTSKRKPNGPPATSPVDLEASVYEFGAFLLDVKERLLTRNGNAVPLTPKVFDILLLLIRNSGSLVSKDSLLSKIWPDAFVEEANLNVNIATLRKALGERPGEDQFIETIPKRGYRFVAKVVRRKAACDLNRRAATGSDFNYAATNRDEPQVKISNSLAVLPFHNESKDPNAEYLSDGLTESIISSLSQLKDLRVLGRNTVFRYKSSEIDPQKIGEELGVGSVLTGRILLLGDRVIMRAEVVDVKGGWQLWGEQYHRKLSDILAIQEEIAEEISSKLRLKLTADEKRRITRRHTDNVEAYHLYLKGRHHWNKYAHKGLGRAIEYFKHAIEEDPIYALAYVGLSDSYYRLSNLYSPAAEAMPKARLAAEKALEIDETLAEAHAALGSVLMVYYWDWAGARRELIRAIELNPGYAISHQRLGLFFNLVGSFPEALHQYEAALDLDPLSPSMSSSMAFEFFVTGDYERAIQQAEKSLELDPNFPPTHYLLGWIHKRRGDFSKALESFQRVSLLDDSSLYLAALGHAYGLNGDRTKALTILDQLEERSKHQYVSSYGRALIYTGLGEKDLAFQWLEKAFAERSEMIPFIRIGADCDSLRSDPRFDNLLRRCGLETKKARVVRI